MLSSANSSGSRVGFRGSIDRVVDQLRERLGLVCEEDGLACFLPSRAMCTDNAAMIAAAGTVKLQAGERADLDLNADVSLRLGNLDAEADAARRGHMRYRK